MRFAGDHNTRAKARTWVAAFVLCVLCFGQAAWHEAWAAERVVRVGVYDNPPKIFLKDDRISGIFGDLINEIAHKEGWTIRPVMCQWQHCLDLLKQGRIDLMPDVALTPKRSKLLHFAKVPALYSWSQIYTHKGINLQSIRDLQGRRILVLKDSVQQPYLKNLLSHFGIHADLVPVDNLKTGFEDVSRGDADAIAANHYYGDLEALNHRVENTPILFQPVQLYFVSSNGRNKDLLAAVDHYLRSWQEQPDSFYYRTLQRWNALEHEHPMSPFWRWGLIGLVVLLLLSIVTALLLRRQVREKSRNLRSSEAKLSLILDAIDAFVYIKDLDGRYQFVNRKVVDLFGKPEEEIIGGRDDIYFDAATAERIREDDKQVLASERHITREEDNGNRDGDGLRTYLTVKQPLYDDNGRVYALCGISTDITEHKQNEERIHQLAFYDPLTGLPNRRLLLDRADHALRTYARSRSDGALLFIDLDNFKVLNDTLGHAQGDILLSNVARRLGSHVRQNDTLARLGGDEFVLLVEDQGEDRAEAVMRVDHIGLKLLEAFIDPCDLGGRSYAISASIGVAMFSDAGDNVEELLKRADMAMYQSKAAGRNQLQFFNPSMQADIDYRAAIEADLRAALKHDEFMLYFQPQVDQNGMILGAEALLRWQHPEKGMVAPAEFIPVAESSGLILPIGRWIVREACLQLVRWSKMPGLERLYLAVNVSARQFHHPNFVSDLLSVIDETGVDPRLLELELTESMLIDDVESVIVKMNQLREHGVRFSLDDFGTGYSSLNYLKRLPLDQLKIDQSFVRDLQLDANDLAIVRTILALGTSLELSVVAEGVESMVQREELIRLGCNRMQGYLFGRPAPAVSLARVQTESRSS